jgi:hypothetical protein
MAGVMVGTVYSGEQIGDLASDDCSLVPSTRLLEMARISNRVLCRTGSHSDSIEPGDTLFLFTDGLSENHGEGQPPLGLHRLKKALGALYQTNENGESLADVLYLLSFRYAAISVSDGVDSAAAYILMP